MANKQQYSGGVIADTSNDVSNFWADCPMSDIRHNWKRGWFHDDDFTEFPLIGTQTTGIGFGKGKLFANFGTIAPVTSFNSVKYGGGLLGFVNTTVSARQTYSQAYSTFLMTGSPATSNTLWFEARIAISTIAANTLGFFLGFAEVDLLAISAVIPFPTSDSTAIPVTSSYLGFRKNTNGLGVGDTVFADRGAAAFTNLGASEMTLAANTFVKLGMKYDPNGGLNMITFYVNGVKTATRMLATNTAVPTSGLLGTTNLKANPMGLMFALIESSTATTDSAVMDWWKCYQLAP